jgi:hypothetical protein
LSKKSKEKRRQIFSGIKGRVSNGPAFLFQDELETVPLCPILSISERNLASFGTRGNSRIQLLSISGITLC